MDNSDLTGTRCTCTKSSSFATATFIVSCFSKFRGFHSGTSLTGLPWKNGRKMCVLYFMDIFGTKLQFLCCMRLTALEHKTQYNVCATKSGATKSDLYNNNYYVRPACRATYCYRCSYNVSLSVQPSISHATHSGELCPNGASYTHGHYRTLIGSHASYPMDPFSVTLDDLEPWFSYCMAYAFHQNSLALLLLIMFNTKIKLGCTVWFVQNYC